MQTIKNIMMTRGEECEVDVDVLNEWLAELPADMYLGLYQRMHMKIYGYPPIYNLGGCCCGSSGDTEDK